MERAGDLTTYAGRAKRRPPGASDFTQRVYRLLHENPDGLTREQIHDALREEWVDTDAYRAYERHLTGRNRRHRVAKQHPSAVQHDDVAKQGPHAAQHSSEFRRRAQRWFIGDKLVHMRQSGSARREGDLWFAARPPKVHGKRGTYVPFDPEESRAVLVSTTSEHVNRENAKAELLAILNRKRLPEDIREHAQAAYDWLCGRRMPG
jgi:hypothetical protein